MKKSVAKKWVKALRSGEYAQTRGVLCREGGEHDSFCCLGVLTELYIQEHNAKKKNANNQIGWENETKEAFCLRFDSFKGALPLSVAQWAGMNNNNGRFGVKSEGLMKERSLAELNDNGKTFEEIANIIEKNVERL